MCGIIAFVSTTEKQNPAQFLVDALKRLEYRGYDSWGIVFGNDPVVSKKIGKISEVASSYLPFPPEAYSRGASLPVRQAGALGGDQPLAETMNRPAHAGLGHTRWATHGGVTDANAHPHLDCTGRIAVVHNGIIENWEELRRQLEERGHTFRSETDTEVVAHLVEEELQAKGDSATLRDFQEAVRIVFNRLEGLNAIVVYSPQLRAITGFRNGSPMVVGVGEGENFLASDIPAFLPYPNRVV
ncbi:MAG: hypothetical protein Q8L46_01200, partial [candidate division WWE3 bacterium]|nr:hypothetical protein [candidate division WWE3 bacterium]